MNRSLEFFPFVARSLATPVATAVVLLTLSVLWVHARHYYYMPCDTDCGETIIAQDQVTHYRLNGFKYGLIQYHAAPIGDVLYTHNAHIGAIVFVLLDAAGVRPFWAKQIVTLAAFGLGLLYVFRATTYFSKSSLGGLIVLLLFCLDYEHVLSFGLNALRAWHWLALFGLAFHIGRLMLEPRPRAIDCTAILALSAIAFGIGYDFWLICASVAGLIVLLSIYTAPARAGKLTRGGWVLGSLLLPFGIRQLQIGSVLGARFWTTDLYYTIGIKVPGMSRLLRLPSLDEIDAFYKDNNILRPPASPAGSFASVLTTFVDMLHQITVPGWGIPFCLIALVVAVVAAGDFILYRSNSYRGSTIGTFFGGARVRGWFLLIAPISIGTLCGLIILAPFSLHVYLKHQFPLLAAAILLPTGFCLSLATESLIRDQRRRRLRAVIMAVLVCLLLTYYAVIQVNNLRTSTVVDLAWVRFVVNHRHATYALSYPPLIPHSERIDWIGLNPGHASEILDKAGRGQPFLQGLIPAEVKPRDYWIYQPVDRIVEFDAPYPTCRRQDPALAALAWLGERFHRAPGKSATWVLPGTVAPGSRVVLGGTLDAPRRLIERIEMVDGGLVQDLAGEPKRWSVAPVNDAARPIKNALINCLRGTFIGDVNVGEDALEGLRRISIRAVYRDGRKFEIGKIIFQIRRNAPRMTQPTVTIPTSHLSVDAVVQLNSGFPIVERGRRGDGYVVFDLRSSGAANPAGPSAVGH